MREHIDWVKADQGEQLLLVKRDLYRIYTLMTVPEFRETEPYVEALALFDGKRIVALIRRDRGDMEMYFEANAAADALFSIPIRQSVENF